jgi:esterase
MQAVELAFECFGEQHGGSPLLILHGFFASSRNWRAIARQLAASHRVYVPDMRNHGASPHAEHMDYPAMAADIALFMDKMEIAKAHFLGHSMGGKIAMWFALHHPQRVEKLMVADIAPVSYSHNFDNTVNALKNLPLNELGNRKQAEDWLASAIPDLNYRQFLLQNLLLRDGAYRWRVNLEFFHRNAHHIVAFPESFANVSYPEPALFLAGESSAYIHSEAVYRLFPQATISEILGTGHWLHVEAPERFCREVGDWLSR